MAIAATIKEVIRDVVKEAVVESGGEAPGAKSVKAVVQETIKDAVKEAAEENDLVEKRDRRKPANYQRRRPVGEHPVERVTRAGLEIDLTAKEYALLEYLARRANEVVGRVDIAEHVWDESFDPFSKVIEVFIQRLRRKIDGEHPLKLIHTRREEGYLLTAKGAGDNN